MQRSSSAHAPLLVMHLSFLFCGAGTLLLAATLPVYTQRWHLTDAQTGMLLAAQFVGLSLGSIFLSSNLRRTLLAGYVTAAIGFALLLFAADRSMGFHAGIASLFLLGLGVGQVTVTINLLSALRYSEPTHRSSVLSLLNFTWSAGAVLAHLLAGFYLAHETLGYLLLSFALVAVALFVALSFAVPPASQTDIQQEPIHTVGIPVKTLVYFASIFLLYGGLEATLGGWLSTYTLRYTSLGVAAAAYCTTAMWAAFAGGRALAGLVLRQLPEQPVRLAGIVLTGLAATGLRAAHTGNEVVLCAILIGVGIAAFFPITFSQLLSHLPTPRQAGLCTAQIGLGSAAFPYLVGVVSTSVGSLRSAMIAPIVIAGALMILCGAEWTSGRLDGKIL